MTVWLWVTKKVTKGLSKLWSFTKNIDFKKIWTCGSIPNILSDGGTLRPLGMLMLPKSTKKATHQTDNQSGKENQYKKRLFPE